MALRTGCGESSACPPCCTSMPRCNCCGNCPEISSRLHNIEWNGVEYSPQDWYKKHMVDGVYITERWVKGSVRKKLNYKTIKLRQYFKVTCGLIFLYPFKFNITSYFIYGITLHFYRWHQRKNKYQAITIDIMFTLFITLIS